MADFVSLRWQAFLIAGGASQEEIGGITDYLHGQLNGLEQVRSYFIWLSTGKRTNMASYIMQAFLALGAPLIMRAAWAFFLKIWFSSSAGR